MAQIGIGENNQFKSMQKRLREMRKPIIEKCIGCDKVDIEEGATPTSQDLCNAYIDPEQNWKNGDCPLASHLIIEEKPKRKVRVGQQKQQKHK